MLRVTRFRLLMPAVVLGLAVVSIGGITFSSSSAGDKNVVTAIRYSDVVRFTVQNEKVALLRAEVFDLARKWLFDSKLVARRS